MGKTRLVEEVADRAEVEHGAIVLEGACVPYGEANVWWPVADALRRSFGAPVGTPAVATRRAVHRPRRARHARRRESTEVDRVAEGLLHLLGEPSALEGIDPTRAREEVTRSLVAYVEGWAAPAAGRRRALRPPLGRRRRARPRRRPRRAGRRTCRSCCWPPPGPACSSAGDRRSARTTSVVLHLDPLDRDASVGAARRARRRRARRPPRPRPRPQRRQPVLPRGAGVAARRGRRPHRRAPHAPGPRRRPARRAVTPRAQVIDSAVDPRPPVPGVAVHADGREESGLSAQPRSTAPSPISSPRTCSPSTASIYTFRSPTSSARSPTTRSPRRPGSRATSAWPTGSSATPPAPPPTATAWPTTTPPPPPSPPSSARVEGVPDDLAARAVQALGRAVDAAAAAELHIVVRRLATQALDLADAAGLDAADAPPVRPRPRPRLRSPSATSTPPRPTSPTPSPPPRARRRSAARRRGARRAGRPRAEAGRTSTLPSPSSTMPSTPSARPATCGAWPRPSLPPRPDPHLRRQRRRWPARVIDRGARGLPLPRRPARRGLGAAEPGLGGLLGRSHQRGRRPLRGVRRHLHRSRRPGRPGVGPRHARLRPLPPGPLRRGRGAGRSDPRRGRGPGRPVGDRDDARPARLDAAVDRPVRRGHRAGRAGARALPWHGRLVRPAARRSACSAARW